MSVLFLDVDGVLNGSATKRSPKASFWPKLVERLNHVLWVTECDLVISSAWRYFMLGSRPSMTPEGFQSMLRSHSVRLHGRSLGGTVGDVTGDPLERGRQVQQFRRDAKLEEVPYAIVDDMSEDSFPSMSFVRTDARRGLQDAEVKKLVKLLGKAKL